ncbi:CHASE domain-containing protein [Cellvibrio sp.]|uniref:CHASE domain-containing protein n=1 Tax=Cellvibrio sp. TaxID=1965322 RepID=UPI00396482B4
MPLALASTPMLTIRIVLLAFTYVLAGRLSLLLALPPGFASAIFPPLGISLAAVLLWGNPMLLGVFLGSVMLNTSVAFTSGAGFNLSTVFVAAQIALGSCLATWVGSRLIRKFVGFPNSLLDEWSIFLFFILGGPVASSVSATLGVAALCFNDIIPLSQAVRSWLTWWTGDAIGVLIAAPFVLILFAQPRPLWSGRFKTVGLPLLISCALIVAVFFNASRNEQQKIQRAHQENAKAVADKLFFGFNASISALTSLKGLYLASDEVTAEDFRLFTVELLRFESGINALSWNQKVYDYERRDYEQSLVAQGFTDFSIKETDVNHNLINAPERKQYVVVTHIEPHSKNSKAHGFNIESEEIRRRALRTADQTGQPAMTEPLHLVQSSGGELSYLIFMPVYKSLDVPKTREMRDQLLRGYVTALITVNRQIDLIHNKFPEADFSISLTDVTESKSVSLYEDARPVSAVSKLFVWNFEEVIGGRTLRLSVTPTQQFIDKQLNGQSWYVLVGGLLFASMLGGFLLLVTGRTQYISSLVERRTLELESIVDEAVEAIIIINELGDIERTNPAACRLFKSTEQEMMGRSAKNFIPVLADLLVAPNGEYQRSGNHLVWKAFETQGITNDNKSIPVEIGVSKVDLPDRRIYICLIHDITARKKVDNLKNEFVSTVSHELRTPLTSITGALGLLVGGAVPAVPDKAMDLLIIAKNNAERLGRLVNDLLDMEKLELGNLPLDIRPYDTCELLAQAIDQNVGYALKYGVKLELNVGAFANRRMEIQVDRDRFLQVMSNLISNAVKFSHMDGVVEIFADAKNQHISVYVKDFGTGIPEEFRSKIFQKFAQADSSDTRKRDGTGLGLSISRVIVERMGGTIDYTTEVDKGSTFFFSFPIKTEEKHN